MMTQNRAQRAVAVGAASLALLVATALPSSAATTTYWTGDLAWGVVKGSAAKYSTGGYTNTGSYTTMTAVNQSSQHGYVYATSTAKGHTQLTHPPRANTVNWASWTYSQYVKGTMWVQGQIYYS